MADDLDGMERERLAKMVDDLARAEERDEKSWARDGNIELAENAAESAADLRRIAEIVRSGGHAPDVEPVAWMALSTTSKGGAALCGGRLALCESLQEVKEIVGTLDLQIVPLVRLSSGTAQNREEGNEPLP